MVRSAGTDGVEGTRGPPRIPRPGGSARIAEGVTRRRKRPGRPAGSRRYRPPARSNGRQSGKESRARCGSGVGSFGAEQVRGAQRRTAGRGGGWPEGSGAPSRGSVVMFRLQRRSVPAQRRDADAGRSVKGAASFSSTSKRKQRRNIRSRSRVIERRRRMPQWQTAEASFTVWSAPAPRQGRAGVLRSGFRNSFSEFVPALHHRVFPTTNPVRTSADARASTCAAEVSRRACADVEHRHAKRLQGFANAISMFLALARPCSRARAVDVVSVRARMRSSTLIRR